MDNTEPKRGRRLKGTKPRVLYPTSRVDPDTVALAETWRDEADVSFGEVLDQVFTHAIQTGFVPIKTTQI
jgi:hypothetical protein